MPQFFVDPKTLQNDIVEIRGKDARHLQDVLRLGVGDWVVLCDGKGQRFRAEIIHSKPLNVQLKRGEKLPEIMLPCHVTLAAAVIRPQRFDWLVEKVFELGCRRLIPITTERTVDHYIKDARKQQERWSEIALSAAKQSGLPWMPEVVPLTPLADVLKNPSGQLVYCWEGSAAEIPHSQFSSGPAAAGNPVSAMAATGPHPLASPVENCSLSCAGPGQGSLTILIGPEGGFSSSEHESIMTHNPKLLPLGQLILRSETAAMAALVKVMS